MTVERTRSQADEPQETHARLADLEAEVQTELLQAELLGAPPRKPLQPGRAPAPRHTTPPTVTSASMRPGGDDGVGHAPVPPITDRPDLVDQLQDGLVPGEFLHAVLDLKGRGPAFLAITSKRVILYDRAGHSPLRTARTVMSVPFRRLVSVGLRDDGQAFASRGFAGSSTLVLTTSTAGCCATSGWATGACSTWN